ncbi:MAG: class I SAM-dependent methyltransferase [Deltaproteobacteria bacterium]|nr:class I SAM-dependent methyltransferase [Deltaproteobacteria bacterium]
MERSAAASALGLSLARREGAGLGVENGSDAVRLVHGAADGFAGLTADRLGPAVLVERHDPAADAEGIIEALARRFGAQEPIFLKERWSKERADRAGGQVRGAACPPDILVPEQGLVFGVSLAHEEHIGLFLDARPARALVRRVAEGRRVLNLFSYTGTLGAAAAVGGALSSTNVDVMRSALATARDNYARNGLAADTRTFLRCDVFQHLARAARSEARCDLIVVDPPPRAARPGRRGFDARTGYGRLLARCLKVLAPNGLILAGTNLKGGGFEELEDPLAQGARLAGRNVEIVERVPAGPDFPQPSDRPAARFVLAQA